MRSSYGRKLSVFACLIALASCFEACSTPPAASNTNNNSGGGSGGSGGTGGTGNSSTSCQQMTPGQNASLGGFVPFPGSSLWNTDVSAALVDPNSDAIITNYIGSSTHLHPDFGPDPTYGIPYVIVTGTQNLVAINLGAYGSESDPGPMPVPSNAPVEGGASSTGDRHVLVLDNGNCFLYELYNAAPGANSSWSADSTAVWDLLSNQQRPYTWTSADAAGLPIFPGLVRYDEAAAGNIPHAFRFTVPHTRAAFIPPASHWASNTSDPNAPPMGMRLRLKSSYDISGFSAQMQVILTAMKKYGLILADNGSALYVTGASDSRWGSDLDSLKNVPATAFEVVQMNPIYTASNTPSGSPPAVTSFTASPASISAGSSATLTWNVSNASYVIISPGVGAVRGSSVTVNPSATTTYTLYATNQYDRSTATVTVTVP
jgi:hypothetical protein